LGIFDVKKGKSLKGRGIHVGPEAHGFMITIIVGGDG